VAFVAACSASADKSFRAPTDALRRTFFPFRTPIFRRGQISFNNCFFVPAGGKWLHRRQPGAIPDPRRFPRAACYVLCFSIIMLNTDRHSSQIQEKDKARPPRIPLVCHPNVLQTSGDRAVVNVK